jgi:elongation factor P--(R)-beta-lysine ligase
VASAAGREVNDTVREIATTRVLAPSDLYRLEEEALAGIPQPASASAAGCLVGGRVLAVAPAGRGALVTLGDAFASVEVELESAGALSAGDLVVVSGTSRAARLVEAHIVDRMPARSDPDAHAETARFARADVGRALAARAAGLRAIRGWFDAERFLEVDTPALVPSPGLDVHLAAFEVADGPEARPAFLSTSPEYQMKRLLAGGVPRCFQLAHCFRRGERGARHNPEFTMLEWYRAFAGVEQVIDDTEELVRAVARAIAGGLSVEVLGVRVDLAAPFQRLAIGDAFARWAGTSADEAIAMASEDETRFFRLLVDAVEPALARQEVPVFLTDWPAPLASLARVSPRDARVCERFELYVAGVELCNGFGELTDPTEQRRRFEHDRTERARQGLPVYPIDERFLAALEEGMPPAAGNALGVDRLIGVCLGLDDIASTLSFPVAHLF